MWNTATYWFDIALVSLIFAMGNILFGHFEEHRPKLRRLLKVVSVLGVSLMLSYFKLRWVFYSVLSASALGVAYIHAIWLPRQGVNGWTGEPKDRYLELVRGSKNKATPTGNG